MTIKIFDPVDENRKYFTTDNYVQEDNHLYVRTEFTNCVLHLKLNDDGTLYCPEIYGLVGKMLTKTNEATK